jgi:hypothetical protein
MSVASLAVCSALNMSAALAKVGVQRDAVVLLPREGVDYQKAMIACKHPIMAWHHHACMYV